MHGETLKYRLLCLSSSTADVIGFVRCNCRVLQCCW